LFMTFLTGMETFIHHHHPQSYNPRL